MAARELRYGYFEELRTDWQFDKIAVAHHRDDNVETLLLHLVRGTGLKGLTGMRYRNGYVIRPMLDTSREEIERYLAGEGQSYVCLLYTSYSFSPGKSRVANLGKAFSMMDVT